MNMNTRIRFTILMILAISYMFIFCSCETSQPTIKPMSQKKHQPNNKQPHPEIVAQTQARLKANLKVLAGDIGERHVKRYDALERARTFLEGKLKSYGYTPALQSYEAGGKTVHNIEVEIKGKTSPNEIVVIGAHYDTVPGTPGADDNGTGTVGVLELARHFAKHQPKRTVRFVLFVNEEPPFFQTEKMGSLVYARRCASRKENIVGMLSLEMLGYYSDVKKSQTYPPGIGLFYPDTGNFIGFVGNPSSSSLNKNSQADFKKTIDFPNQRLTAPTMVTGVGFSDHWSFWQAGYKAIMVTDTAFMRNHHYHEPTDTPDTIDYPRLTKVVLGLVGVVGGLID